MKLLTIILLFFIYAVFISFSVLAPEDNKIINTSAEKIKFERHFTQYNPDFYTKGIVKSSFRHEAK